MTNLTIFKNALLIDGTGADPLADAAVVVEGGRIKEVDPSGNARGSAARTIDLAGKTLMPGLMDAHVHPGNVELYLTETAKLPPAVYVHRVTRTLEMDLALGFTTLRDAGGLDQGFREAVQRGLINGPRLRLAVTPLTQSGAYPHGPPPARNSLGVRPEVCDGPEEVRKSVRLTLGRGADHIKVFADGEVVAQSKRDRALPGQWKFSVQELKMAAQTARAAGTYVMAHAYGPRAIQNCITAGIRTIEHGNLLDEETAELMARHGVYYVPTLTVYDLLSTKCRDALDGPTLEKLEIVGRAGRHALELAYRAGVKIGSGSDIIGPLQHLKGCELVIKTEVMTPMEAIVSATRTNAELMGLAHRTGTIEPGKSADLIVVNGNPLEKMALFEKSVETVTHVMIDGQIRKQP